jgi:hypothetical protein
LLVTASHDFENIALKFLSNPEDYWWETCNEYKHSLYGKPECAYLSKSISADLL